MSDMNPSKLFNYYLQSMETEYNMAMINEVNALLGPYDTKLILYTYDSLLFDFNIGIISPLLNFSPLLGPIFAFVFIE